MLLFTLDFPRKSKHKPKGASSRRVVRMVCSCILLSLALAALLVSPLQAQEFVWAAHIGGTTDDWGQQVALDAEGNIYLAGNFGRFGRTVDFDPGPGVFNLTASGEFDMFVAKFDGAGNFLWARSWGGADIEGVEGLAIDGEGNIYTGGYFYGPVDFDPGPGTFLLTPSPTAGFISKLDADGDFIWARHIGSSSIRDVAVDGDGSVYATGSFSGTADFDPGSGDYPLTAVGSGDIFVVKLDSDGNLGWARQMGGDNSEDGLGIAVDGSGNVLTTGDFRGTVDFDPGDGVFDLTPTAGSPGGGDVFVSKLDGDGNFVWARQMGGPDHERGWSVAVDGDGNVVTTGHFDGVADFDPGAAVFNVTSAGEEDVFVSKLDSAGNFVWARRIGGTDIDSSYGVAVDENGSVYTTGSFRRAVDFDPGSGVFNLSAVLGADGFVSKLDSAGNFVWAQQIGGSSSVVGRGVAVGGGSVYALGSFDGVGDFNPQGGGFPVTSNGQSDVFLAKYADVAANVLRPQISEGGIVLATLLPKVETVSALSIISVFGEHFTDETVLYPNLRENGKIDYMLGGVCLTMNGEVLPIFAVTPGQINAQVSNLQGLGPATFVAISNCGTSAALSSAPVTLEPKRAAAPGSRELASDGTMATVEEATPGFFIFDPVTSDGYIAARFNATEQQAPVPVAPADLFPNDSYGPSRPAVPGDIVLLFGTGWGPTEAFGSAGYPISGAGELLPGANPMVTFGGAVMAPEDVLYVGVTPGYAGLYQLAIRIPATAQPGNNQVVLTVYGKSTPTGPVVPVASP